MLCKLKSFCARVRRVFIRPYASDVPRNGPWDLIVVFCLSRESRFLPVNRWSGRILAEAFTDEDAWFTSLLSVYLVQAPYDPETTRAVGIFRNTGKVVFYGWANGHRYAA